MIFDKKPPTEEEIAAQQAEARKATAEGEFVIICEDKKRVLSEKISIEKDIEENKGLLDGLKNDITNGQKTIVAITTSISEAKDSLNNLIGEKETISSEIENLKVQFDSKKNKSETTIAQMTTSYEEIKKQKESEIKFLESSKKPIFDGLKEMVDKISLLRENILTLTTEVESLSKDIDNKNNTIKALEFTINRNQNIIDDQDLKIGSFTTSLSDINKEIADKGIELETLKSNIVKKTEEYKTIESKAFVILQKSDLLTQKEAFIKGQYERAGIKWE